MRAKVIHVVGARPNFMKVAPVMSQFKDCSQICQILVHTGQHYDVNMSDVFFQQLCLPAPHVNLEVGSGSHATQTANIMMRFEEVVLDHRPDLVMVYGDVNSTVAAALVCAKLRIPVAHVEAGLRSYDRGMPEEINRLLTDQIAALLFTPSSDGNENLLREGVAPHRIHLVGNVMIDSLVNLLPEALKRWEKGEVLGDGISAGRYGLVTLHRPSNVDVPSMLVDIITALDDISQELPLIFPIHPRTRQQLANAQVRVKSTRLRLVEPLGYLDFLALQHRATFVITDSGGIQEETTFLGVPCLTLRENTERPITITLGTNILIGRDIPKLRAEVERILAGKGKQGSTPPLWDGHASHRIAETVVGYFSR